MVKKAAKYEQSALAITDHGNMCSIPQLFTHAKENGIKPIAGMEAYICDAHSTIKNASNRKLHHLVLLAKNLAGWKTLLKIHAKSFSESSYYYKGRISLEEIGELNSGKNLIAISGHPGSTIANAICNDSAAYGALSYEEARTFVDASFDERLEQAMGLHTDVFGKENLALESQLMDSDRLIIAKLLSDILRSYAYGNGYRLVATCDSHYTNKEDAILQRINLCDKFKTNLDSVNTKLIHGDDVALGGFFKSDSYYMMTPDEMAQWHTEDELRGSLELADMVEEYDIFGKQECPTFDKNINPNEQLKNICYGRLADYLADNPHLDSSIYQSRLDYEFSVILPNNLADYFLIVKDIMDYARNDGQQITTRGSVGGSLVAFLTDISDDMDPIEYDLLFERFMNPARAAKELPDADIDCMRGKRAQLIQYTKDKFGSDKVAQCMTFSLLKGKAALRSVMRAYNIPFQMQLEMTEGILEEAKVADDLQEFVEEHGEKSLIKLSLMDNAKALSRYANMCGDGQIVGDYGHIFDQASRLEYVRHHTSIHAGAVIIGTQPLNEMVPLMRGSKGENLHVAVDFPEAERMKLVKIDMLGVATHDRIHSTLELINGYNY